MAPAVLSELGSIASIVGLPLSLIALVFAIYHLLRLRGETRAAREAAEEAQRLLRRETTGADLVRLSERIQGVIDAYQSGDRERALERLSGIISLFIEIRRYHPNLSHEHRSQIQEAIRILANLQSELETFEGEIPLKIIGQSNDSLTHLQSTLLVELEDLLELKNHSFSRAREYK